MNVEKAVNLIVEKLNGWLNELIKMIPNLLLAAIAFVLGLFIARFVKNFARKKLKKYFPDNTTSDLGISLIYVFSIGLVLFVVLKILNLEKTIATALAGAGIVGLALAFAFQDIAANFISGVFISFNKPFHLREVIRVNDIEGVVISIQLRTTTLRTSQGLLVIIPNKNVIQNPIINYTRLGRRRADVKGGVSQGDDLRKVQRVALEALKNVPGVIEKDTTLLFDNLGESTIDFTVRIWLNSGDRTTYDQFLSEVIITLKEAFDANGISLPFPIRTLDFAMKGGEKLSDMTLNIVKKEAN